MDGWERLFREEGETLAFFLCEEFGKDLSMNQYWKHKISGELYAVQVDHNSEEIVSACGPLEWREATPENLKTWNFNNDPELVAYLSLVYGQFHIVEPEETVLRTPEANPFTLAEVETLIQDRLIYLSKVDAGEIPFSQFLECYNALSSVKQAQAAEQIAATLKELNTHPGLDAVGNLVSFAESISESLRSLNDNSLVTRERNY